MIYCKICKDKTNQTELGKFTKHHLKKYHNISSKEYYNKFLKKDNEGFCLTCGKETRFISIKKGYTKFCDNSCVLKNKKIKKIINQTQIKNQIKKYGKPFIQTKEFKNKSKQTKIKKYKNESYCNPEKIRQTFKNKYGVNNFSESIKFRKIMENKGLFIPLDQKTEFEKYRMIVDNETRKHKKELINNWNGKDYYTGEKLLTNNKDFNNALYRTIDHKISVYYGFKNNIDPKIIGNINNLCITSRQNNSKKRHKSSFRGGLKWELETDQVLEIV